MLIECSCARHSRQLCVRTHAVHTIACCVPVKAEEGGWGRVTEYIVLNDKRRLEKHPEKSHDSRKQVYRPGKKARGYWASQLGLG